MSEDNLIEITCPACKKEMKRIFLAKQGINLDVCLDGCGGIYFDNREFKKVDEKHEDITPLVEAYAGRTYKPVNQDQIRICPVCKTKMVKHFVSVKQEVEIDECYVCGGKFLDFGELEKIRGQYNTEEERAEDFTDSFARLATDVYNIPTQIVDKAMIEKESIPEELRTEILAKFHGWNARKQF